MSDENKPKLRKVTVSITKRDAANNYIIESRYIEIETPEKKEVNELLKKAIDSQKELENGNDG